MQVQLMKKQKGEFGRKMEVYEKQINDYEEKINKLEEEYNMKIVSLELALENDRKIQLKLSR